MFIFTKPVVQILLWVTLVTSIYFTAIETLPTILKVPANIVEWKEILEGTILSLLLVAYPLGVVVGDVCLGRYKTLISGLIIATVSMLGSSIASIIQFVGDATKPENGVMLATATTVLNICSSLIFVVGVSILNSNIIQFGLDQLIDKPSESLGIFVHWLVWAVKMGEVLTKVIYVVDTCIDEEVTNTFKFVIQSLPICFLALLLIFLLVSCCTRGKFNHDGVAYNPYKMILNILNFARKNSHPLLPVPTFSTHLKFSRLDYAKERYGGPFKTSDVEDVKSFKSIVLILFALGPVFILDLPMTGVFNKFSTHTGFSISFSNVNTTCDRLSPEFFSDVLTVFILPIYIWLMYSVLRNRRPKIVHRLLILTPLYILAVVSMLTIDFAGHLDLYAHREPQPKCMFLHEVEHNETTLNMHWTVLLFPGVINGCYFLLLATSLEFISAQGPHTMKGILVGTFYAIVGSNRILGIVLSIPFRMDRIWKYGYLGKYPPVISCGFGFYLVCITVALIGFVSFAIAVNKYKYRRRDEESFHEHNEEAAQNRPRRQDYEELRD